MDIVIAREDARPKPDPDGLLKCIDKWSLKPEQLLYMGDFRFDIECGKNAKTKTAYFTNGLDPADDFGADYIVKNFGDFFDVLPSLGR